MSVSDPLVKDIKGCVQQFLNLVESNNEITDNNFYFVLFAQTLEKIFNQGLIRQQNTKYFIRTIDVYAWMISVINSSNIINFAYRDCVHRVKLRDEFRSNAGRFRLLIKYCLMKKCLHVPVEFLVISQKSRVFYSPNSIIGDEILSEIFLSVLRQVSKISFVLDVNNASFLDVSWYIPQIVDMELVPCKNLGIAVSFASNKAVIVNVEPNGVAAENGNIQIGDVLDKLNGIHIDISAKGRLGLIMKCNKNKPVAVRIAKGYEKDSGNIYGPILGLLKELKIDLEKVKKQYEENGSGILDSEQPCFYGFEVKYLAKVDVGALGNVKQVQKALKCLIDNHAYDIQSLKRVDKEVSLEIGEIGLKIRDKQTCDIILEQAYMKISSCGNLPLLPKIFGYCAGEEYCDVAKNFTCHIFETFSLEDTDTILQSIGQGFHRTHYAV